MMAAGNPNWWSVQNNNPLHSTTSAGQPISSFFPLLHHQFNLHGGSSLSSSSSSSASSSSSSTSSSLPFSPLIADQSVPQDFPQSWSQLLLSGLASTNEEERLGLSSRFQARKQESWEGNHVTNSSSSPPPSLDQPKLTGNNSFLVDHHHHQHLIKQELAVDQRNNLYGHGAHGHDINHQESIHHHTQRPSIWSQISPKSCVTTLNGNNNNNNNNLMAFSTDSCKGREKNQLQVEHSSECNSPAATTGVAKKARVQTSSTPPLKVRKEKLGDRITALHQLVSPFGKTDTASVLLEAIGYIRFLQGQIEALSSPFMGNASASNQHSAHGERNCLFPEHPGQLLNDSCMKRRGAANQQDGSPKDLRSRGLCLVPISCPQLVGSDNGADYWAPSLGGGF